MPLVNWLWAVEAEKSVVPSRLIHRPTIAFPLACGRRFGYLLVPSAAVRNWAGLWSNLGLQPAQQKT
jgi:hypothetical protein